MSNFWRLPPNSHPIAVNSADEDGIYSSISWVSRQDLGFVTIYGGDTIFRDSEKLGVIRLYEIRQNAKTKPPMLNVRVKRANSGYVDYLVHNPIASVFLSSETDLECIEWRLTSPR